MKNIFSLVLVAALALIYPQQAQGAGPVKVGANCTKVNATKTVGGKKFTCIKNGKKLVWDSGLAILAQPIFTATSANNNYEWDISVTNYQKSNLLGLEFSYSFAVDGGIWNLYSKTNLPSEKLVVNQAFNLLELKVAVSDSNNRYVTSPQFQRQFRTRVIPPLSTTPNNSSSSTQNPSSAPTVSGAKASITRLISGVQNAIAKVHYVNNLPRAKRILRWPNQNQGASGKPEKIIIVYENMRSEAPPCDLSQALCQSPTRVDTKIYFKVLNDGLAEVITLEDLQIDSEYQFGVYAVSGEISESEIVKLARPQFFLAQSSGLVPDAPTGITVGSTPGNIRITASTPIEEGFKLLIIVIGGKFGTSTTVATLTAPQEILVPAPDGYYQITSRMVSPSGINGGSGQLFAVTVK